MFPKYAFSLTRFLLIVSALLLAFSTNYQLAASQQSTGSFVVVIGLLSISFWYLFRFFGLIERISKMEEIRYSLSKGLKITIPKHIEWRKVVHSKRSNLQKNAAYSYYKSSLKRVADLVFSILIFSIVILQLYSGDSLLVWFIIVVTFNSLVFIVFITLYINNLQKKLKKSYF